MRIRINGMGLEGREGETIMQLAERSGIDIPHFCWNERLEPIGACRLCVVEVKGMQKLAAACSTPLKEGMEVQTHSPRALEARRTNLKLLLANHDLNCTTCKENLSCKLQKYASEMMINETPYAGEKREAPVDDSSVSIRRDNNKCILCEQCVRVCGEIQTVHAIGLENRGFRTKVSPPFGMNMRESACVNCGQCVIACPTAALSEKSDIQGVISALNSGKHLVAQTAPSIRVTLGECFGMQPGSIVTGKMVSALKEMGFNKDFDTDLAADITIIEEATEFIKRLKEKRSLPMITTCCPAWIKFGEQFFYDEMRHMSSCRSPQAIMASLVKTYYAEKSGIDPRDIVLVDVMPCTAKKYEVARPEFAGGADFVLTTVELGKLLSLFNVDLPSIKGSDFDSPLGESSGAGAIFGRTGGVMEAALRTAADWLSGKGLRKIDYRAIRGMETMKEAEIDIGKKKLRVCAVHTLGEARRLLEQIRAGTSPYHFIEIMACYGGCVGGGGQPRPAHRGVLEKRMHALMLEDEGKPVRKSHKNPAALRLYREYLGEFGSKKAHKLLHTSYSRKDCV